MMADDTQSWAVTVERDGDTVVTIASNCLSGRDLSAEDERVIRMAAEHLRSFVGASPSVVAQAPLRRNRFDCASCGQGIAVDEDGCCRSCGADATVTAAPVVAQAPREAKPRWVTFDLEDVKRRSAKWNTTCYDTERCIEEIERLRAVAQAPATDLIEQAAWCGNSIYHDDYEQGRFDARCGACSRSVMAIRELVRALAAPSVPLTDEPECGLRGDPVVDGGDSDRPRGKDASS